MPYIVLPQKYKSIFLKIPLPVPKNAIIFATA